MENEKTPIFSGGIYSGDIEKLLTLHRGEVVLTNEQAAELMAKIKRNSLPNA